MEYKNLCTFYLCRTCSNIFDQTGNKYPNSASINSDYISDYQYGEQLYKCFECKSKRSQMESDQKKKTEDESISQEDSEQQNLKTTKKQKKSKDEKQNDRLFYSIQNKSFRNMIKKQAITLGNFGVDLFGESQSRVIYLTIAILYNGALKPQEFVSAIQLYFQSALKSRQNSKDKRQKKLSEKQTLEMMKMINQFIPKISHIVIQGNFLQGICQLFWSKPYDECKKANVKFQKQYKQTICLIMKYFGPKIGQVSKLGKLLAILRSKKAEKINMHKTEEEYIDMKCQQYFTAKDKNKQKKLLQKKREDMQQQLSNHIQKNIDQINQLFDKEYQFPGLQQMEEEERVE